MIAADTEWKDNIRLKFNRFIKENCVTAAAFSAAESKTFSCVTVAMLSSLTVSPATDTYELYTKNMCDKLCFLGISKSHYWYRFSQTVAAFCSAASLHTTVIATSFASVISVPKSDCARLLSELKPSHT